MADPSPDDAIAAVQAVLAALNANGDHFALLQVPPDVGPDELRDAYFRLAKLVRPDQPHFQVDPHLRGQAVRALQALAAAHATLADPSRRRSYVQALWQAQNSTRRVSGVQPVVDFVGAPRQLSQILPILPTPRDVPRPLQMTNVTPVHRPIATTGHSAPSPTTPSGPTSRASSPTHTAPVSAEAARAHLNAARLLLSRRDWASAQESLQLALPALDSADSIADCKVLLGSAIFNNGAIAEEVRLERAKQLWNEVATQHANTPYHAQAAYHLSIWHKLHGEAHHRMRNLQICLNLQPNHADALREKRMLDQRQDARAVLADLEASIGTSNARRASSGAHSKVNLKKEQPQSWLSKLLGGRKTEK